VEFKIVGPQKERLLQSRDMLRGKDIFFFSKFEGVSRRVVYIKDPSFSVDQKQSNVWVFEKLV
jgi:hypothetical protein